MQHQKFSIKNEKFILENHDPEAEVLIALANQHLKLLYNQDKFHKVGLHYLLGGFRDFLKQNNQLFWISTVPQDGKFPFKELQTTLKGFLKWKEIWGCDGVSNNFMHEHFVVLFWIAALRYTKFPLPVRQYKFAGKESKGQLELMDLFFFNMPDNNNIKPIAAFALQINALTHRDIHANDQLKPESFRSGNYIEKHLTTGEALNRHNSRLAKANAYAEVKSSEPKTLCLVVSVTPYKVTWKGCGLYDETVTSEAFVFDYPSQKNSLIAMYDDDDEEKDGQNNEISLEESQTSPSTQSSSGGSSVSKEKPNIKNYRTKENYRQIPAHSQSTNVSLSQGLSSLGEGTQDFSISPNDKDNTLAKGKNNERVNQSTLGIKRANCFKEKNGSDSSSSKD